HQAAALSPLLFIKVTRNSFPPTPLRIKEGKNKCSTPRHGPPRSSPPPPDPRSSPQKPPPMDAPTRDVPATSHPAQRHSRHAPRAGPPSPRLCTLLRPLQVSRNRTSF